jgi:polyphosphate kinase
MTRNLDKRLELLFPVSTPRLRRRLIQTLRTYFDDNVKAWQLQADGTYQRVRQGSQDIRAQEVLYQRAVEEAHDLGQARTRFKPLKKPEEG